MKLRLIILCLSLLFAGSSALIVRLVSAQDAPPDGGMDAPVGTPRPLPTRAAFSNPIRVQPAGNLRLETFFISLMQGQTGLARVFKTDTSGAALQAVRAAFAGKTIPFFQTDNGYFYGLIAASMETPTGRTNPLIATATYADGTTANVEMNIEIGQGPYFRQNVTLPAETRYLLDADTERNELARLDSIFETITPERMWETVGFRLPIEAELTSAFGLFRTFNGALNTRHTGWDIRTTAGQPVAAVASGRVAFAGLLTIRGNHIVIDHGYGVYSGYSHLSAINVARGDAVTRGAIIGMTGTTGRVNGAHFHWEMAVNGEFVDGVQLISMWMP
jgi:murein DD-endopeptidase MepM/ murein hydrolase activator NlpD